MSKIFTYDYNEPTRVWLVVSNESFDETIIYPNYKFILVKKTQTLNDVRLLCLNTATIVDVPWYTWLDCILR